MMRVTLLSLGLSAAAVVGAEPEPAPPAPLWTPPATIWSTAGQPAPVAAPKPVPVAKPTPVPTPTFTPVVKRVQATVPAPMPGVPAPSASMPTAPLFAPLPGTVPVPAPTSAPLMNPMLTPAAAPIFNQMMNPMPTFAPSVMPGGPHTAGNAMPVTMPLSMLANQPLPTTPTVPAGQCAPGMAEGCAPCGEAAPVSGMGLGRPDGACLDRLRNWLCFQPGPSVFSSCLPAPAQSPARAFVPCVGGAGGCTQAGCGSCGGTGLGSHTAGPLRGALAGVGNGLGGGRFAPGAFAGAGNRNGCADGSCGAGGCNTTLADRYGFGNSCDAACLAPKHKGIGAHSTPSNCAPVTGPIGVDCVAIGMPLPAACVGTPPGYVGCHAGVDTIGHACRAGSGRSLLDAMFPKHRTPVAADVTVAGPNGGHVVAPHSVVPVIVGFTRAAPTAYRFADPLQATPAPGSATQPLGPQPQGVYSPSAQGYVGRPAASPVRQAAATDPARPFTRP